MTKISFHRMSEADFDTIKMLKERANLGNAAIAEVTKRSFGTITRVNNAATWAEYKEGLRASNAKYKTVATAVEAEVTDDKRYFSDEQFERIVIAIEALAKSQARLADAWESKPTVRATLFGKAIK